MPLCPQITNTAITVTQTADFTVTNVTPIVPATTADTGSLQTQITTAQATADGKNRVTYSTSSPSGSGTNVGDIWWQYSAGIIIGQWAWNGSSWASSPIANAVIANIDAGKITAGIISGIEYNNGSGTFQVTPAGALTATNATITGAINATSGYIGSAANGWNFSSSGFLTNNGGSTILYPTTAPGGNASTYAVYSDRGFWGSNLYSTSTAAAAIYTNGGVSATQGYFSGTAADTLRSLGGLQVASNTFSVNTSGAITATTGITASGAITTTGNISTSGTGTITAASTLIANGDVNLGSSSELRVPFAYNTTTGNAANVWISSTGQLRRSTSSSERYKTDIVNLVDVPELDPKALYSLPVRAFRFKDGYLPTTDDRVQSLVPGFIAEEMDAIYPIAVDYGDGVETWNDRIIVPALLSLVQDLSKRVEELEARNA